ncbi:phosphotransferase [Paenibacillus sp. NPDC058174]|uniref:phosphotransferase n=1 Tax=Paenibacillus sp. NPDC058174 TaxID=3346366 RepID=UPI0036DC2382
MSHLKEKLVELIDALAGLERDRESFGLLHFDLNDGNYSIDFDNGDITVYDFENSCYGWYMYELADIWINGTGWVQFEPDAGKRKQFMDDYYAAVLEGYRSETSIDNSMLEKFPLFLKATLMEGIVDSFEVMRNNGEGLECDEELSFRIKCLEDDIPYRGFFHDIYSCEAPFQYEERTI